MKTRKLVRRTLSLAALSTASLMSSFMLGAESGIQASGIQLVQYQPGQQAQNASQSASSVESELRKMFEANGQPMPSMRPQDLPNANVVPPSQMKPNGGPAPGQNMGHRTNGNQHAPNSNSQPQTKSSMANPPKKNFLQKFMGKVSGNEKKAAEAAVVPPVPPGYREPAPAPPSDAPSSVAQNANNQQMRQGSGQPASSGVRTNTQNSMPQNRVAQNTGAAQNNMAPKNGPSNRLQPNNGARTTMGQAMNGNMSQVPKQPQNQVVGHPNTTNTRPQNTPAMRSNQPGAATQNGHGTQNNVPTKTAQSSPAASNKSVVTGKAPFQPVPQVPFRSQTATAAKTPTTVAPKNPTLGYVQPGNAPAFMSASQMTSTPGQKTAVAPSQTPSKAVAATSSEPAQPIQQLPPVDDSFEAPFSEVDDTNDVLDLDALTIPTSAPTTITETIKTPEPAVSAAQILPTGKVPAMAEPAAPTEVTEQPVVASSPGTDVSTSNPNNTIVSSQAAPTEQNPFTGVRLEESSSAVESGIALPTIDDVTGDVEVLTDPAPPMNEFGNNLPAITLPPAEDVPSQIASGDSEPTIPQVQIPEATTTSPEQGLATPASPENQAAIPADGLDVTEPNTGNNVEAERLQQVAEQERMLRQQRQIQSRAGQAGFKGFCPVTLRDKRDLTDSNPEFTATFGLQTYAFATAEAKAAFEADPSRYAPAAGGSDIVLLVNSGEEQQGMLDYALWYRDRLYMFRSRETMSMFNQDPQRYANQY